MDMPERTHDKKAHKKLRICSREFMSGLIPSTQQMVPLLGNLGVF
ncbi:Hypothetical protein I595_3231 [Croceitalea dokdonensis DOKDO 023]|uniref:Uncharacterized protein n=1 Tax=Croceitalea dokdonensis DOKDO 023 TaxID=1300341 RepID=A0A0P7AC04_9FLAO|nr:Hypothetical protein I595_3231 [Croceitalea dokdonensis DOKDO 023]